MNRTPSSHLGAGKPALFGTLLVAAIAVGAAGYHFSQPTTAVDIQPTAEPGDAQPTSQSVTNSPTVAKGSSALADTKSKSDDNRMNDRINQSENPTDTVSDTQIAREQHAQQMQYIKEIAPDNSMIPVEKTQEEAEQMLAEMKEFHDLRVKIENEEATQQDKQRYYDIHAGKIEEELEFIRLCQDVAANTLNEPDAMPTTCTHVAEKGDQRARELQKTLQELGEKYL